MNAVNPSSHASLAQLAERQTGDLKVPSSHPSKIGESSDGTPQAAEVTKVAAASASIETAEAAQVAAAPAPTEAAKVTKVAAAPGLADVAGLLRQQVPNRRSFPSSAEPPHRARERCPLPPRMLKPKSEVETRVSVASTRPPTPNVDYSRLPLARR